MIRVGNLAIVALLTGLQAAEPSDIQRGSVAVGKEGGPLNIVLRGSSITSSRPTVRMIITNRGARPVCIYSDALKNPNTDQIGWEFRKADRSVPPLPREVGDDTFEVKEVGIVRLQPGATVSAIYNVRPRVRPRWLQQFPRGWSAQAEIMFGYCQRHPKCVPTPPYQCTDAYTEVMTSRWQPLDLSARR
jgi:hypothetical protein